MRVTFVGGRLNGHHIDGATRHESHYRNGDGLPITRLQGHQLVYPGGGHSEPDWAADIYLFSPTRAEYNHWSVLTQPVRENRIRQLMDHAATFPHLAPRCEAELRWLESIGNAA